MGVPCEYTLGSHISLATEYASDVGHRRYRGSPWPLGSQLQRLTVACRDRAMVRSEWSRISTSSRASERAFGSCWLRRMRAYSCTRRCRAGYLAYVLAFKHVQDSAGGGARAGEVARAGGNHDRRDKQGHPPPRHANHHARCWRRSSPLRAAPEKLRARADLRSAVSMPREHAHGPWHAAECARSRKIKGQCRPLAAAPLLGKIRDHRTERS